MSTTRKEINSMAEALSEISDNQAHSGLYESKGTFKRHKTPAEVKKLLSKIGDVKASKTLARTAEESMNGKASTKLWVQMKDFSLYRDSAVRAITELFQGGGVQSIMVDDGSIFKEGSIVVVFKDGMYI